MMRLAGKKALVTGAGGGLGRAVVARLEGEGAVVAGADRSDPAGAVSLPGDLEDRAYVDALPGAALAALGGLDILVNNAGVIPRGVLTQASDRDYELCMAVNVEAPMRLCRAAIPLMAEEGGGAIVNVASCWGVHPGPGHPLYVMSKAAVASLTQCLGRDHARENIRVNAVCPNEIDTPMLRSGFAARGLDPENGVAQLDATVPLGRIAKPEEIAAVIAFLASDDASYMCGALLEVNGGKPVQ